ncbi:MAG TPA: helix-turn-helix domain-containing protein [Phycisphaerae bacterium]|nr:helix-turn-helix domain-containing protein [Phycisphaerae bacterium]
MKANSVRRDNAEGMLLEACGKCDPPYPPEEALASIESAYSEPRTSIKAPESPLGPYTVPRCIAQRHDLKASDKLVWAALDYRQWNKADCFPSMATIAKDTGLNPDTVNEAVKRLEKARLLTVERSEGEVNHYTTHLPEIPSGSPGEGEGPERRTTPIP